MRFDIFMDNHKPQTDKLQANTLPEKAPTDDKKIHHEIDRLSGEESKHKQISKRAYQLWYERGCPDGCADEDWFRAESEITMKK